jgi:hypothetical protein
MKIAVAGTKARLYVNGATEPCLIVNDLKLGGARRKIVLWAERRIYATGNPWVDQECGI